MCVAGDAIRRWMSTFRNLLDPRVPFWFHSFIHQFVLICNALLFGFYFLYCVAHSRLANAHIQIFNIVWKNENRHAAIIVLASLLFSGFRFFFLLFHETIEFVFVAFIRLCAVSGTYSFYSFPLKIRADTHRHTYFHAIEMKWHEPRTLTPLIAFSVWSCDEYEIYVCRAAAPHTWVATKYSGELITTHTASPLHVFVSANVINEANKKEADSAAFTYVFRIFATN